MNKVFSLTFAALMLLSATSFSASGITINGAGASFPYPLYSKWADQYYKMNGLKLNYQSIGSGGGITQIKAKTVDFGASDAPLKAEELEQNGLIQFPMVMGGVVPVINVEGIKTGELKLTGETLADIYLGKIKQWNAPEIAKLNPSLRLPKLSITVVHRADGSGTTWIFTNYLDKISNEWHEKVGTDKAVEWPAGIGGKGNEGVAAYVQQVSGSIGYVEFTYAEQNKLNYTRLRNRDGNFTSPTVEAFQAAATGADWKNSPGYYVVLTDQKGNESWPITGASFILVHKDQKDIARAKMMLDFFDWCLKNGERTAVELHYIPMPKSVVTLVNNTWTGELKSAGKQVWLKK